MDDHPLVREWLTNLINQQPDLEVCGEAEDARRALGEIERLLPDVAIVDITLASGSGLELVKDIKSIAPGIVTIVLSMHDEATYAERALRSGARGYVTKRDTTKKIISAIREVLEGRIFISDDFKTFMTEKFIKGRVAKSYADCLSDRELEVFRLLGHGIETRKISESLNISIKTVQVYCSRIKEKLKLQNATELLCEAVRRCEAENKS